MLNGFVRCLLSGEIATTAASRAAGTEQHSNTLTRVEATLLEGLFEINRASDAKHSLTGRCYRRRGRGGMTLSP